VESDGFEVEATIEVDSRDNVLEGGHDTLNSGNVLLFEGKWGGGDGDGGRGRGGRSGNGIRR
jgi:hypothetical protein